MQDQFEKEKLRIEVLRTLSEKEHFHREVELLHVLEGSLRVSQEGHTSAMGPHDTLIVNSGRPHSLRGAADTLYLKLSIQYQLISDILESWDAYFWCDSTKSDGEAYAVLEDLLRRLLARYLGNRGSARDFLHISLCYRLLDHLCTYFLVRSAPEGAEETGADRRVRQISNFIQSNYASPITLKELSERLYLSTGYLSRLFQKRFGMTFNSYLNKVRLHNALDQLLYSELPITRIVYDNGFANATMFNKAFREEYGETPTAMRKRLGVQARQQAAPLSEETSRRLADVLWRDGDPEAVGSGGRVEATHDGGDFAPMPPVWNEVLNIGAAADLLRPDVRAHALFLHKRLGVRSLRFWNIFSPEMLIDPRAGGSYNFSRVDNVLDFLTENGILPFLVMANIPRRIVQSPRNQVDLEERGTAGEAEQWTALLEAFLRHEAKRHGPAWVSRWRFEFWLPFEDVLDPARSAPFLALYRRSAALLRRLAPPAEAGCCCLLADPRAMEETMPRLRRFFGELWQTGQAPDFVSLYLYPYHLALRGNQIDYSASAVSSDKDFARHSVEALLREAPELREKGVKLYITEWNCTISHRNWLNDSCWRGAWLLRNVIDLLGRAEVLACYLGSDCAAEYYDSTTPLFGAPGLLSRDGILKPAGWAMAFLNHLLPKLVGKGENYLLTTDGAGNFALLCHNLRELGHQYYLEAEDRLDRDHLMKYYADTDPLELRLSVTGVENGPYRLSLRRVNELFGSALQRWRELNCEQELSRDELRYLENASTPNLSIQSLAVEDGTLRLEHSLRPNEIALMHIVRQV